MSTVVISSYNTANFPEGGGHFWVYMQYIQGLRRLGCEVYWMEEYRPGHGPDEDRSSVRSTPDPTADERAVAAFLERARRFGLAGRVLLYLTRPDRSREWIGVSEAEAEGVVRQADLMLNFHYAIAPGLLAWPRRTALVDIDPGLLQVWMNTGQLSVAPHDFYLTTGETVGTARARFPDCGLVWVYTPRPVCLELWPVASESTVPAFTTVSGWWSGRWIKVVEDGQEVLRENTHGFDNITALNFAASDHDGEVELYVQEGPIKSGQLTSEPGEARAT